MKNSPFQKLQLEYCQLKGGLALLHGYEKPWNDEWFTQLLTGKESEEFKAGWVAGLKHAQNITIRDIGSLTEKYADKVCIG